MEACSLASGSSGNCFYIADKNKKGILIDAGVSSKQIVERLNLIGRKPENIKAIFITHEHADHIRGADVFSRQFNVPIFVNKNTEESCFLCLDKENINHIKDKEIVSIGELEIEGFSKSHKAAEPIAYNIYGKKKISVITDLGYTCTNVVKNIADSDFLFLESNHDENMLEAGPYPFYLKKWIKSNEGHLSNFQAAICVLEHASPNIKNIVLSHISKINNTPELALRTFGLLLKERKDISPKLSISSREFPTEVFRLS